MMAVALQHLGASACAPTHGAQALLATLAEALRASRPWGGGPSACEPVGDRPPMAVTGLGSRFGLVHPGSCSGLRTLVAGQGLGTIPRDTHSRVEEYTMAATSEKALHADLTRSILGAAICVQDGLGVGLYEKPYKVCLAHALREKGHKVLTEISLDITFMGLLISDAYRIDLLVDDLIVVETKTVERLNAMHQAQVLTYLRLSGKEVGLLLNFWASPLKDGGIQRLIRTPGARATQSAP